MVRATTGSAACCTAATGAAASLVVNNCAAAMLLILDTFARGREAIVARNALIEIGGGFRLPDVLARSGATLVEVGATNKVYVADFARALSPDTGLILRAHPSNYRISGFVADVVPAELAALGRSVGVPVIEDLGTGALFDLRAYGLPYERTVRDAVSDGMELVAFSGDKLLGGPQAGIIVGTTRRDRAAARESAAARVAGRQGDARRARRDAASARRCGDTRTHPALPHAGHAARNVARARAARCSGNFPRSR